MHRRYFPPCTVDGPIEPPVPFSHLAAQGAVPAKCGTCAHLFEGESNRAADLVEGILHLDYGPCGVEGPTDPVRIQNEHFESVVEVPRKCSRCVFLDYDLIRGFICSKDRDKWGDCDRGLDWGDWSPDFIYVRLPHPKKTTRAMLECVLAEDLIGFIKQFQEANPGLSIQEAKTDYKELRRLMEQAEDGDRRRDDQD